MERKTTYYVIQNNEGKFFRFDNYSGGYPCFTDDFENCKRYYLEEDANKFLDGKYAKEQFSNEFVGAKVRKIIINME